MSALDPTSLTTGEAVRSACRSGRWHRPTPGLALGFVQANLVALPAEHADDFQRFCQANPQPCPLLEVVRGVEAVRLAPGSDLRTDLPGYRVWRDGTLVDEIDDARAVWQDDFVAFLIGCSFTFENALLSAGLPVRHLEEGVNVPMFRTNRACEPAGRFAGPLVVSMRPMTPAQADRAADVCSRYPRAHGGPVHVGDPTAIGIADASRPDYGDAVTVRPGEVSVFWACGVTPQAVALAAKVPFMITHSPGHMFVTDLPNSALAVL